MTDHHDRGAYTPQSDAPLAFDARSARGPAGRPLPLALIISGVILVVLIAAMVVFFVHSANEKGAAPSAGESIDAIKTAPVPEAKAAPQAQGVQIGYAEGTPLPPTATPPETAPATGTGAPTFTKPPEAPGARTATPAPKAAAKTEDEIIAAATAKPKPAVPAAAAVATPTVKTAPKPDVKLASATPPRPAVAASTAPLVQIGAFSTAALAEQSWNGVAAKIPGKIAGKTLKVEKAEVDGKTLNRALVGGFGSKAEADSFCEALKAQGGVCSVRN